MLTLRPSRSISLETNDVGPSLWGSFWLLLLGNEKIFVINPVCEFLFQMLIFSLLNLKEEIVTASAYHYCVKNNVQQIWKTKVWKWLFKSSSILNRNSPTGPILKVFSFCNSSSFNPISTSTKKNFNWGTLMERVYD